MKKIIETRKITAQEIEKCSNQDVQFIGSIQPHGFALVVDRKSLSIVQYSENFLELINKTLKNKLSAKTKVLGSTLNQWMSFNKKNLLSSLSEKSSQITINDGNSIITAKHWECLAVIVNDHILFEFIPCLNSKKTETILRTLSKMIGKVRKESTAKKSANRITKELQRFTGYDRVMIYQFHSDWTGEVVAESVSRKTKVKYLGLRFPA